MTRRRWIAFVLAGGRRYVWPTSGDPARRKFWHTRQAYNGVTRW